MFSTCVYTTRIRAVFHILLFAGIFLLQTGARAQFVPETQEEDPVEEPQDSLDRVTPRGSISGFLQAVSQSNYERASQFLNMSQASVSQEGDQMARILENFLNRRGRIYPYSWISAETEGRTDDNLPGDLERVGSIRVEGEQIDLYLERIQGRDGDPIWQVSSATLEQLDDFRDLSEQELLVDTLIPQVLKEKEWGGVSVGQWLLTMLLAAFAYVVAWSLIKLLLLLIPKIFPRAGKQPTYGILRAFSLPIRLYAAVWLFIYFTREVGISIIVRQKFSGLTLIVGLLAFLILLWRLSEFIGRFSKYKMNQRGNISGLSIVLFLQRAAKVGIVIFGIIAILDAVGVDVTTGLAALGIGGIALALGAQKTVENFVGSVTVITDQPVRVGDFCKVGTTMGTVEKIGMRSTRIRTLDRTVVTIPNGQFSSENIENFAHRDKFKFHSVLGMRYETSTDQLRFLLVELRAILYAHPLVSPDPARVRFIGLGADALQLEIFAFITVTSYDEFLEVREDLLLRMMELVEASGTGFAFPSQTVYLGRDSGISKEKSKKAEEKVRDWKEKGELQIPQFDPAKVEELKGKTTYPPEGSAKRRDEGTGTLPL